MLDSNGSSNLHFPVTFKSLELKKHEIEWIEKPKERFKANNTAKSILKNIIKNRLGMNINKETLPIDDSLVLNKLNLKYNNTHRKFQKSDAKIVSKYNKLFKKRKSFQILDVIDLEIDAGLKENKDPLKVPLYLNMPVDKLLSNNVLMPIVLLERLDLKKFNLEYINKNKSKRKVIRKAKKNTFGVKDEQRNSTSFQILEVIDLDSDSELEKNKPALKAPVYLNKSVDKLKLMPIVLLEKLDLKKFNHKYKNTVSVKKYQRKNNSLLEQALQRNSTINCNNTGSFESFQVERITVEVDPMDYYPDLPFKSIANLPFGNIYPVETIMKAEKQYYVCIICRKKYKLQKRMQKHVLELHGIEDMAQHHPCALCIEVFELKRDLNIHIANHFDKNGKLTCPEECSFIAITNKDMEEHNMVKHPHLGILGRNWFYTWMQ